MWKPLVRWVRAGTTAFGLLMVLSGIAAAASFDCSKAGTRAEKMICGNSELSGLDERLSAVFQEVVKQSADQETRVRQKRWISEERDRCKDSACMSAAYKKRIAELEAVAAEAEEVMKIIIDTPKSGWRNSFGEKVLYTQKVSYPASSVETQEEQSSSAVIEGRVTDADEDQRGPFQTHRKRHSDAAPRRKRGVQQAMVILHRGPTTLKSAVRTARRRPGSSSTRHTQRRLNPGSASFSPGTPMARTWTFTWVTPDGKHCFYGNRVLENGSALDVDVTTGYGPEIFATPAGMEGTYLVFVNYFGGPREDGGEDLTVATVSVVLNENTADERVQTPLRSPCANPESYSW